MKLKIRDIPAEGLDLAADASGDPWLRQALQEAFRGDYRKGKKGGLELNILKTCENLMLRGEIQVDLVPTCSRCSEPFLSPTAVPVDLILAPKDNMEGEDVSADDVNFSSYEGDEIDLSEIVRETLVLSIPLRYLCRDDCKGLCPHCGQNLNQKSCSCRPAQVDPRLAVLKNYKFKRS